MRLVSSALCRFLSRLLVAAVFLVVPTVVLSQDNGAKGKELYDRIKGFTLSGAAAPVKDLVLNRDRAQMTFNGTFYFPAAIDGRVTGAVFIGEGRFVASVPPSDFEKLNVRRLLGTDVIESTFKTAVMRFSDDTFEKIGKTAGDKAAVDADAQKLASENDARILKQTGANLAARIALSILNQEQPGFFFASFDGGKRGHFNYVLDYQNRIPTFNFEINGGEKGLIFTHDSSEEYNKVWMAFYAQEDYERQRVAYSDVNDLIDITHYDLRLDLREHKKSLSMDAHVDAIARAPNIQAITFLIGEDLPEADHYRLKKQLRLKQVRVGGKEIAAVQEDWEGGFTVFLPGKVEIGQLLSFEFTLQGDFMYEAEYVKDCYYPISNTTWFPHHGFLDRATFDLTFHHPKKLKIAASGTRLSEAPDPQDGDTFVTRYKMDQPVDSFTFALAPFERHSQTVRLEKGGILDPIPIEYNSLPGSIAAIREDVILEELDNSLRYFTVLFGKYPYGSFGAAFHPFDYGQGLATLLMIPARGRSDERTFMFIAHETSHQWWGDIVTWRSYRDQWLSEGFADYSSFLYLGERKSEARDRIINRWRRDLLAPPEIPGGLGKGRLVDVGPIILGHRLETAKTEGAYEALIYTKGALVLRMLHYLFSDPTSGNADAFFDMMRDFVQRYRNKSASTDDFREVANEHFAKSPIARIFHMSDLNWFFKQWVYQSELPSYEINYDLQPSADGKFLLSGTLSQDNVPNDWFMCLPVVIHFGDNQEASGTVYATGPKGTFHLKLPMKPTKVELDPHHWVLSEKTVTKGNL